MATDIDEPEDLVELLIHGKGAAKDYIESNSDSKSKRKGRAGSTLIWQNEKCQNNI